MIIPTHLVFENNDRPGILTARGVERLIMRHSVLPGQDAVVVTTHDGGYHTAILLNGAGANVIAVIDGRKSGSKGEFEKQVNPKEKKFVVAGGVAANKEIRNMLIKLCKKENYEPVFPPIELCGDNAAMIAMVGLERFKIKQFDNLDHPAKPRWPLDENAAFLKGAGVKF